MSSFFERVTRTREPRNTTSGSVAKDRLKLVLIHDRTDIPPAIMEELRDDLMGVIARYVDFVREDVEVHITRESRRSRLVAEIPLRNQPRTRSRR